jgi:hypothetical protein
LQVEGDAGIFPELDRDRQALFEQPRRAVEVSFGERHLRQDVERRGDAHPDFYLPGDSQSLLGQLPRPYEVSPGERHRGRVAGQDAGAFSLPPFQAELYGPLDRGQAFFVTSLAQGRDAGGAQGERYSVLVAYVPEQGQALIGHRP